MKSFDLISYDRHTSRMKIAAAVIGGVASLGGSIASGVASNSAANTQANAANQAAQLQQQQYQQTRQDLSPYNQAGTTAIGQISKDQATGTGFAAPFTQASFMSNPGYQFQLQQGQNAINSSAAANGGSLNGGTLKALDQYTTGLANSTYNQAYQNYLNTSNQQYNQLLGVAGLGEGAAAQTGQFGANAANASGNYLTQAGSASAAGTLGVGSAVNSGLGALGTLGYGAYQAAQSQSGYQPVKSVSWNGGGSGPLTGTV